MVSRLLVIVTASLALWGRTVGARLYERCELAQELAARLGGAPPAATWVCIAQHESSYDTGAVGRLNGDGSADHGLFQISDRYWCDGGACGLPCSSFTDDDISDDLDCALYIHQQHTRLSGDGFSAWTVYPLYCNGPHVYSYIDGCFDNTKTTIKSVKHDRNQTTTKSSTLFDIDKLLPITTTTTTPTTIKIYSTNRFKVTTTTSKLTTKTTAPTTLKMTSPKTSTLKMTPTTTTATLKMTTPKISTLKMTTPITTKKTTLKIPPPPKLKPLGLKPIFSFGTLITSTPLKYKSEFKKYNFEH
ncbi:uncharacterized protein LOC143922973 [Arctopsyche grandis]|uniref:uncharacterized protein LOC143922973 n=1 Tax=Arctopsyche grandis TaxID=121162 RepID=UPI00406D9842